MSGKRVTYGPQENPELAASRRAQAGIKQALMHARGLTSLAGPVRKSQDGTELAFDDEGIPIGVVTNGSFTAIEDPASVFYNAVGVAVAYRTPDGKVHDLDPPGSPTPTQAPAVPTTIAPTTPVAPVVKSATRPAMSWEMAVRILKATSERLERPVIKSQDSGIAAQLAAARHDLDALVLFMEERGDPRLPDASRLLAAVGESIQRGRVRKSLEPFAADPLTVGILAFGVLPREQQAVIKSALARTSAASRRRLQRSIDALSANAHASARRGLSDFRLVVANG